MLIVIFFQINFRLLTKYGELFFRRQYVSESHIRYHVLNYRSECEEQTHGFSNGRFKGFSSREEADNFVGCYSGYHPSGGSSHGGRCMVTKVPL